MAKFIDYFSKFFKLNALIYKGKSIPGVFYSKKKKKERFRNGIIKF